jgi:hypothetical protein
VGHRNGRGTDHRISVPSTISTASASRPYTSEQLLFLSAPDGALANSSPQFRPHSSFRGQ